MTDTVELRPAPLDSGLRPVWQWRTWQAGLFGSRLNTAITLACLALMLWLLPPLVRWALIDAVWQGGAEACRQAQGACWAFIGDKLRFILFGLYPPDQQWRPMLVVAVLLVLLALSGLPALWRRHLVVLWLVVLAAAAALMSGWFGLPAVPTEKWSGLPVTLLLSLVGYGAAFPLAIALALGRRSSLPVVRLLSVGFIEITRSVPLISVLYVVTLLLPLMLPAGTVIDKLLRAQIGIILFVAAYQAEIVRAGLQAIPSGQYEAAHALGLSYGATLRLIILPQALRTVIPSFVTLAIGIFHDTTLVLVIGVLDVLNTARAAAADPDWLGFYDEAFGFVALLFFGFSFAASRYSLWLERHLKPEG